MKARTKVELLPGVTAQLVEKNFGQTIPDAFIVRENPRTIVHRHSYGGLSRFFQGLTRGDLWGTVCHNARCRCEGVWLPPRVHCPDCWEEMAWILVDATDAKVYTHSITNLPGAGFLMTTPCPLISVEILGVCTKFMSYLSEFGEGEPYIGMSVKPVFRIARPTYTILDVSWVPKDPD